MWKQPVVIDNRPGGGSLTGTTVAVRAAPDGYTLLATSGALAIAAALNRVPFDPLDALTPLALMAQMPYVLAVHPSLPVKSTQDLIALAKANPGKYSFGSAGTATATHLVGEMFKSSAGVDLLHVPYKGGGPAINALIGNEVQVLFNVVTGTLPQARSGKLRALAVTSAKRAEIAPELPPMSEGGLPGFDVVSTYTLFGPARMSPGTVRQINSTVNAVLVQDETKELFSRLGVTPVVNTPEALARFLKSEIARWTRVVKTRGIKAE
jgi:tripartite-type tricarboxylate transporter receptor subunit TctC